MKKSFHEHFTAFLETPSRESFREFMENNLGESDNADFKTCWPAHHQIVKHTLAMSNSGGGVLIIGVKQCEDNTMEAVGLPELVDKAELSKSIGRYLPKKLRWDLLSFSYTESEYASLRGKRFQVLYTEAEDRELPYTCEGDGEKLRKGSIYIRNKTESLEATYDDIQNLINRRIMSGYDSSRSSRLIAHLEDLKALYTAKPEGIAVLSESFSNPLGGTPLGDLDNFLDEMIEYKQSKIKTLIESI